MTFQSHSDFSKEDVDEGWIAGDVYMRVYVCALITVCLFCLCKKRKKKKRDLRVLVSKSPP